ncbi:unnamed protein product [Caenorhabditis sp. 36 PRJEB53466]|nr:unnamed protein product [Caenorhabditis sp. 36 PRJEB53466]
MSSSGEVLKELRALRKQMEEVRLNDEKRRKFEENLQKELQHFREKQKIQEETNKQLLEEIRAIRAGFLKEPTSILQEIVGSWSPISWKNDHGFIQKWDSEERDGAYGEIRYYWYAEKLKCSILSKYISFNEVVFDLNDKESYSIENNRIKTYETVLDGPRIEDVEIYIENGMLHIVYSIDGLRHIGICERV